MAIIHDPALNIPAPVALTAAASLIAENGLSLDTFVDYAAAETAGNLSTAPVCAAGAIRIAYGHAPDNSEANSRRCPALAAFADWLICTQRVVRDREPDDEIFIIAIWNDIVGERDGTDAVVADLRRAAAEVG